MTTPQSPAHATYDIVIVGGAIMGASAAWFLSRDPDFDGRILVIERDPSYRDTSTMHTTSCIRQQFSTDLNVRISQFGADFIKNLRQHMGDDPRVPELSIRSFGYMYLADTADFADVLRDNHKVQQAAGAATQLMDADQIKAAYPFYNVDDILLGSINTVDEGYFDAGAVFDWLRRQSREKGVEYLHGEVTGMTLNANGTKVDSVTLSDGQVIGCGQVLNASGPRAALTARMAGIDVPIEPRKRYSWVFKAEHPLDRDLPLTIDPSGVHVRENGGGTYQAGGHSDYDPAVAPDDFAMDFSLWENHIWPVLATRIPQFESIRVTSEWTGHYAMNTLDHNAVLGPHHEVENFYFLNGFSGHGLQQAPAMGRGIAELMVHGAYRTLDLGAFHWDRIPARRPILERAII
ncbi:FAD-binding oxidoreductase [Rhodobacteraceae bacterium KMM 6894]|nr:FAD-binding oxidoreductase [Rhodobacteraceae bacterium KMM 6894]